MKSICVIGSLNVDLTVRVPRFPAPGESITGLDVAIFAGGKGGNQAVAASRLGADTLMVGCLGGDQNGEFYKAELSRNQVSAKGVRTETALSTGLALIEVDPSGENRIVYAPGANNSVTRAQIDELWPLLSEYDIFLFQLEIPLDTIVYAAGRLHGAGKTVLLDPAPAQPLPGELLRAVDYLTPNETELSALSGLSSASQEEAVQAARLLLSHGVKAVLAKRGKHGALFVTNEQVLSVQGFTVQAVDTTAAGDSFNAGFAVALSGGMPIERAIRFANAVGALSTTAMGAQGAMPTRGVVERLLEGQ